LDQALISAVNLTHLLTMPKRLSYYAALLAFPLVMLAAIIPFSSGSFFDVLILPLLFLYNICRFLHALGNRFFKAPVLIYLLVIGAVTFLRFFVSENPDIDIAAVALRLSMPFFLFVFFSDCYEFISRRSSINQKRYLDAVLVAYIATMDILMTISLRNGIGEIGLGLSFPLYTDTQLDRHVYGPAVAIFTLTCFFLIANYKKFSLNKFRVILIFVSASIGVFSSFASGSRSPLIIFAAALIYSLPNLLRSVKLKSIVLSLSMVSFIILAFGFFANSLTTYSSLIDRSFGSLNAIFSPFDDHSRGDVSRNIVNSFSSLELWITGAPQVVGSADSGPLNLLFNGGMLLVVSFFLIWAVLLFVLRFSIQKVFLVAVLTQFIVGSETLFIPRYCLVVSASFFILSLFVGIVSPVVDLGSCSPEEVSFH